MRQGSSIFQFSVLPFSFPSRRPIGNNSFLIPQVFLSSEQWHQFSKYLLGAWQMAVASARLVPTYQSGSFPSNLSPSQLSRLQVQCL